MCKVKEVSINEATLLSYVHEINAIKSGIELFEAGKVESSYSEEVSHAADVDDKGEIYRPNFKFSHDGQDIKKSSCQCDVAEDGVLCKHIVAGILAIQGGLPDSELVLGKVHQVSVTVNDSNTAIAMKSGSLAVFATPSMVALMEQAASELLEGCISKEQTSVGTIVDIKHLVASPIGAQITATAEVERVYGRKIEFIITATDGKNEIGKGKHTRMIVDAEKFMSRL